MEYLWSKLYYGDVDLAARGIEDPRQFNYKRINCKLNNVFDSSPTYDENVRNQLKSPSGSVTYVEPISNYQSNSAGSQDYQLGYNYRKTLCLSPPPNDQNFSKLRRGA